MFFLSNLKAWFIFRFISKTFLYFSLFIWGFDRIILGFFPNQQLLFLSYRDAQNIVKENDSYCMEERPLDISRLKWLMQYHLPFAKKLYQVFAKLFSQIEIIKIALKLFYLCLGFISVLFSTLMTTFLNQIINFTVILK